MAVAAANAVRTVGNAALPSTLQDGGALRPPDERVAVDDGADVRPGQRQRFAEIKCGSQLADGFLSRSDLIRWRRMLQPFRQRFFAGPCARNRKQLEKRSMPEKVDVVGKQMAIVPKPISGLARSDPPVLDTCQAPLVEANRPVDCGEAPQHPIVPLHEHEEQHAREEQPARTGSDTLPRAEQERRTCGECQQAGVAETPVLPGERLAC